MVKDSGNRRKFESGAQRDVQTGKGRCDLIPLDVASLLLYGTDEVLVYINYYVRTGDYNNLINAIRTFISKRWCTDIPTALLEVAVHYEEGANKYDERNWEKGIPIHCYIDSGVRHYLKFLRGDDDEPHNRAFIFNMLGAVWTHVNHPKLRDLPFAERMTRPVKFEDKGCVVCGGYAPEGTQICSNCKSKTIKEGEGK